MPDFEEEKPPDYVPPDGAEAEDAIARRPPVHHAGRRPRLALRAAGPRGRAAADALRAARVAVRQPALRAAREPAPRSSSSGPENPYNPVAGEPGADVYPYVATTYRLTEHHTAGGMSRFVPYLVGAPAGDVRRGAARSSPRSAGSSTAAGRRSSRARTAIEARVLVTDRMRPLTVAGPRRRTRSACRTTGASAASRPATRRTTCAHRARPERAHPGGEGVHRATSGRAGGRAARRCRSSSSVRAPSGARGRRSEPERDDDDMSPRRAGHGDPTATEAKPSASASSPTRRSASAARRARSRARSGTSSPRTATSGPASPTTTPASSARTRGATSRSSSSASRCSSTARRVDARRRTGAAALADGARTSASTARTPPASTSARPARSSAPSSARSSCRRTSATAAATACRRARSACSTSAPAAAPDDRAGPRAAVLGKKEDGRVWKCTLCYDRLKGGHEPACAKACPTDSIQFGELDELRERADAAAREAPGRGLERRAALRPRPRRRRRRLRRVLPAARRAGGLRPAARPGRHDAAPAARSGSTTALAAAAVVVGVRRRRSLGGCGGRDRAARTLVLRPADPQGAGLEAGDPVVLLHRRARRRVVGAARSSRGSTGNEPLARTALYVGAAADVVCPALLDLRPRPARALPEHAARLQGHLADERRQRGSSSSRAARRHGGRARAARSAEAGQVRAPSSSSALFGPPLATYTGALLANTAIPVWHEARHELPWLFGASAAASAGAAAALAARRRATPARRGGSRVGGVVVELALMQPMEQRLGFVGEVYKQGEAGRYAQLAKALHAGGRGAARARGRRSRARRGRGRRARPRRRARAALVGLQGRLPVGPRPAVHGRPAARAGPAFLKKKKFKKNFLLAARAAQAPPRADVSLAARGLAALLDAAGRGAGDRGLFFGCTGASASPTSSSERYSRCRGSA